MAEVAPLMSVKDPLGVFPIDHCHVRIELLEEAIAEHALETGDAETPVAHFVEWLAEWGREIRRRQRGLMLLTAHRAKGLEFDHVVVLDGGWDHVGRGEDPDAPRRLYYVAMTRARHTLTMARFPNAYPFLDGLTDAASVLGRSESLMDPPLLPELSRRYRRMSLSDVVLSFAGYRSPSHPVHCAIATLSPGDPLQVRCESGRWELLDQGGVVVGRLASGVEGLDGMRCSFGRVLAVVRWGREYSEPEYVDRLKCDSWEVFEPDALDH